MHQGCRIGFAGTDARTLLSALVVSTAKSEIHSDQYQGLVLRGTPAMPVFAGKAHMDWPVEFIPTQGNSAADYAREATEAIQKGKLDYLFPLPEALLFQGLVDDMDKAGLGDRVAGLTQSGSFLEADKIACKKFCRQAGVPVAPAWTEVDAKDYARICQICLEYIHEYGGAVLKYPYSAGGKGARLIQSTWDIRQVYQELIQDYKPSYKKMFKNRKWPLLLEAKMSGVEISFTILVDSQGHYQILPTALDYPERYAAPPGRENPITGGMGSISPHPLESEELLQLVRTDLAEPLIQAMRKENMLRPCVLYPGCFVSFGLDAQNRLQPKAIRVCEINIRPGEPEFQPVVRRLRNLGPMLQAMFTGQLHQVPPEVRQEQISLCLALVTGPGGPDNQKGYPWSVTKFEPMQIDFSYLVKKNIQLVPSAMGYDQEKGFYSDGTRVAYLNLSGSVQKQGSKAQVAQRLRQRALQAFDSQKVRVIPREEPQGNRLDIRRDIGLHFTWAEELLSPLKE
ncbi:MAG: hypothetical protein ACOCPO_00650 [Desulfohalobiaceae bacterium]